MAFTFARHQPANTDSKGPTPGARALKDYTLERWNYTSSMGIYKYRKVAGGKSLSLHSEGRALDIGIPIIAGAKADAPKGMAVVNALGAYGQRLGIEQLIYNRTTWASRYPEGKTYTGKHPHYDHIHVSLTRQAGANLNIATLAAVIDGSRALIVPPAERIPDGGTGSSLESATHRVSGVTNFLNMRSGPSVSSPVVGELDLGVGVQQVSNETRMDGGTSWSQIRASVGGSIVEGWAASKYLTPTGIAPAAGGSTGLEPATHRVSGVTNFLNMRSGPSVSSPVVGELDLGVGVQQLSNETRMDGGTSWSQIRSSVGGSIVEGWAASKYLTPTGIAPAASGSTGPEPATHRVKVEHGSSLHLRSQPALSAPVVIDLTAGSAVIELPDPHQTSGGHEWVKVRTVVDDRSQEGWVANEYLEPADG